MTLEENGEVSPIEKFLKKQSAPPMGFVVNLALSSCCGAEIKTTTGGVIMRVCSKCMRPVFSPVYGGGLTVYGGGLTVYGL
jgi:hypothetical protein